MNDIKAYRHFLINVMFIITVGIKHRIADRRQCLEADRCVCIHPNCIQIHTIRLCRTGPMNNNRRKKNKSVLCMKLNK